MQTKTWETQFSYVNFKRAGATACLDHRAPSAIVSRLSLYSVALATATPSSAPLWASWLGDFFRESLCPSCMQNAGSRGRALRASSLQRWFPPSLLLSFLQGQLANTLTYYWVSF